MTLTNAHVATVVRSLAGIKGWSTNALATQAGEPTPNVRRYFWTGERPIPFEALAKVAAAFGLSTSELLRKAEQVEPEPFVKAKGRTPSAQDEAEGRALDRTPGRGRGAAKDVRTLPATRD